MSAAVAGGRCGARRDAVTERDPETQGSEVAAETEDQANQPGRLAGTLLMFRDLWRLVRGEDQRGRKVRWLLGLLRPYRTQVVADDGRAADRDRGGAGAALPRRAGDRRRDQGRRRVAR